MEANNKICPSCGMSVPAGDNFCSVCGSRVDTPAPVPVSQPDLTPPDFTLPDLSSIQPEAPSEPAAGSYSYTEAPATPYSPPVPQQNADTGSFSLPDITIPETAAPAPGYGSSDTQPGYGYDAPSAEQAQNPYGTQGYSPAPEHPAAQGYPAAPDFSAPVPSYPPAPEAPAATPAYSPAPEYTAPVQPSAPEYTAQTYAPAPEQTQAPAYPTSPEYPQAPTYPSATGYSAPASTTDTTGGFSIPAPQQSYPAPDVQQPTYQTQGVAPAQPGYAPQQQGYGVPGQSPAYPGGDPFGGAAQMGYPGSIPPATTATMAPKKKKAPIAAIIVILAIVLVGAGVVVWLLFFMGGSAKDADLAKFQINGIEMRQAGEAVEFSFTATNDSDKTIDYFEIWYYCYDADGNPVVGGNAHYGWTVKNATVAPGETFSPASNGYWRVDSDLADVQMIYCYVGYIEYTDGSSAGISDINDDRDAVYKEIGVIMKEADKWAKG